jgi:hypothetical protein
MLPVLFLSIALGGCASWGKPHQRIPARGNIVTQGVGPHSFRAPGPGLVSVYDVNMDSIVNSSAVEAGSVVSLNPVAGNITVTDSSRAGTQIVNSGVSKSHHYEMWFIPQEQIDQGVLQQHPSTTPVE